MNKTYLEISIFDKQNPSTIICTGKILLEDDGWFDGIEEGENRFLFGVFLRPNVIQLNSMDNRGNINNMKLSRGYGVVYEGNTSENLRVQMIIKSL